MLWLETDCGENNLGMDGRKDEKQVKRGSIEN